MIDDPSKPDLGLEQKMALRNAASRLQKQFDCTFNEETIERFLYSSYNEFATRSTVLTWLPLLAEKSARQRLNALARVEVVESDLVAECGREAVWEAWKGAA